MFSRSESLRPVYSPQFYFFISLTFVFLIAGIDYFIGTDLSVIFLYFVPIYLVTWNTSARLGFTIAATAGLCVFFADFGQIATRIVIWNTSVRSCVFFAFAYLISERSKSEKQLAETQNELFQLLETMPVGVFVVNSEGKPFYANQVSFELLGQPAREDRLPNELSETYNLFRSSSNQLYPAEDLPISRALKGERCFADDIEIQRDGRRIPLNVHAAPIHDRFGKIQFAVSVFSDVSESRKIERELIASKKALESGLQVLKERNEDMILLNEFAELLQSSLEDQEVYHLTAQYLFRFLSDIDGAIYRMKASRNLLEAKIKWGDGKAEWFSPEDCWAIRKGQPFFAQPGQKLTCKHLQNNRNQASVCVPMTASGQIVGVISMAKENGEEFSKREWPIKAIAERAGMTLANLELRKSLQAQAIRDPLTDLYNRRYMEETLERELGRTERKRGFLALVLIDLDHFKHFNDTYGHSVGDELLKSFARLLGKRTRKEDIVCRYGGEEFLLILPDCSHEDAVRIADQIRMETPSLWPQIDSASARIVSASAGVSAYPVNGNSAKTLILAADHALYEAKAAGRNCVVTAPSEPA